MEVIKRDGRKATFNIDKVKRSIKEASNTLDKENQISDEKLEKVLEYIETKIKDKESMEAEELLTLVQNALMFKNCYDVATAYIKYSNDRAKERLKKLEIMKEIKEKLDASNVQNQNANLDEHSFGGRKGEAESALLKKMALDYYMSPKHAKNHINNRIYQHDLDSWILGLHNCVQDTSWVKVSINGNVKTLQLADLIEAYKKYEKNGEIDFINHNIQILARDGFTTLKKMWVRKTKSNEKVYTIYPTNGLPLVVTGEHKIPVLRNNQEILTQAKNIQENDKLISLSVDISESDCKEHFFNLLDLASDTDLDLRIANSHKIYTYLTYKYDVYYTHIANKLNLSNKDNIHIVKSKDKIAYNGISSKLRSDVIRKITVDTNERVVVDLETESHWFVANNYVVHNCLSVPIDELLANGFKTRQVFIRPAGSVNTALQLIAVLFQLQSLQQFGGVAGTHVDWTLVPYVRKSFFKHFKDGLKYVERKPLFSTFDKVLTEIKKEDITKISIEDKRYKRYKKAYQYAIDMLKKEIYQGCEGLAHNLNSLQSRAGNQLPFSSINYGTCTEPEGRMFTEAMLNVTIKGVGNGQTSIFPCQIFQYKKGINDREGTPNYDLFKLAIESTSKRLYPNYCNEDNSNQKEWKQYDIKVKNEVLSELSQEELEALYEKFQENPELAEQFGIIIEKQED